jgi:hypothetical protein
MNLRKAVLLGVFVAAVVGIAAVAAFGVPLVWAILIAVPAGVLVGVGGLLSGTHDAEWTAPPELPAAAVTLHATFVTERLEQAARDPYRFTARVQPRLRRIAVAALGDLDSAEAKEKLGPDLHRLLTDPHAGLPKPPEFAALMQRLEEQC